MTTPRAAQLRRNGVDPLRCVRAPSEVSPCVTTCPLPVVIQGGTPSPAVRSPRTRRLILGDIRHTTACDAPHRSSPGPLRPAGMVGRRRSPGDSRTPPREGSWNGRAGESSDGFLVVPPREGPRHAHHRRHPRNSCPPCGPRPPDRPRRARRRPYDPPPPRVRRRRRPHRSSGPGGDRRPGVSEHRRSRTAARPRAPGTRPHVHARGGLPARCPPTAAATSSASSPATPPGCRWRACSSAPATAARWSRCPPGSPAEVGGGRIVVGDLAVSAAAWWDPRPRAAQPPARLCCPRACASCATRSTARVCRTARSPCRACRPAPAAHSRPCVAPSAVPTSTRRCARRPGSSASAQASPRPATTSWPAPIAGLILLGHPAGRALRGRRLLAGGRPHHRAVPGAAPARRLRAGQRRVRRRPARPGRRATARPRDRRSAGHRRDQRPGDGAGPVHRDRPGRPHAAGPLNRHTRRVAGLRSGRRGCW